MSERRERKEPKGDKLEFDGVVQEVVQEIAPGLALDRLGAPVRARHLEHVTLVGDLAKADAQGPPLFLMRVAHRVRYAQQEEAAG